MLRVCLHKIHSAVAGEVKKTPATQIIFNKLDKNIALHDSVAKETDKIN